MYKVITKALANCLKLALSLIISNEQSAFVLGHLISDNFIVAFEAMHSLHKKIGGKMGLATLKLDMSKAYDWVELMVFSLGYYEETGFL